MITALHIFIQDFLDRLRRQTGDAAGGLWVELHREAGRILTEDLPALEAALPPDQPELDLELAEA